jgi:DNA polymerase
VSAQRRTSAKTISAAELMPDRPTLSKVRAAAAGCQACDLYKRGTQTVFGEGSGQAHVMLVGEQPRDAEDLAGRVKHFKWEPRGKRRIHKKPNGLEIAACRPWLETEIALVSPRALVCLGATAAQALLGRTFRVSRQRGEFVESPLAPLVMATVHPSSILRAPDDEARREETTRLIADLRKVRARLSRKEPS